LRLRLLGAVLCVAVCALALALAPAAVASNPGGVSPVESQPAPAKPHKPRNAAPVTARTPNLAYNGPVYERLADGQVVPYAPAASAAQAGTATGGAAAAGAAAPAAPAKPELLVPGSTARYVAGLAAAPMAAPLAVQEIVWAGDQIIGLPYIYGGGHASFVSPGYDCSGTVSFALHGAALLATPEDSSEFMGWGSGGIGRWVTIFSNPEHAYMTVAGIRLDTSAADDPSNQQGPRWRPLRPANSGFTVRHPRGL
jgi:cell wall-associated NlpC family hydrolase